MEKESKETHMTAEELRNRLYHSLRDRGLVDSAKSQLRYGLVSELQQSAKGKLSLRDLRVPAEGSLLHKAANSLIADHLRSCHYDYTFSVFLPESGTAQDKIFSTADLLKLLNINPQSHLYKKLASSTSEHTKKGFLWQFLCEVSALHTQTRHDNAIQADLIKPGRVGSLDSKFQDVDNLFASRQEEQYKTGSMAMEERLLLFQRQQEERYRSDLKLEVARVKENEIARIRMEEKEKSRQENDRHHRELQRNYQSKSDALVQRERNSIERLQREQELHEKEIYAQRQTLLGEIEALRLREGQVRREEEVIGREKKLEDDRRKAWEQQLRSRENSVKRMEIEFEQRLTNEMTKFKLEQQAKFLERTQNLEARDIKLKEDERRVGEDKDKIQTLKDDLRDRSSRVNELETTLQELRHKEVSASRHNEFLNAKLRDMTDYSSMKEQNIVLRNELETLRNRMAELLQLNERERTKQEDLLRDIRRPTPETLMMQRDLEKAHNDLKNEQVLSAHQKQQMDKRLQDELDRNRDLLNRFEEQTLQMRDMNREMVGTKQQLSVTHQALNNEVYRKPHPRDDRNPPMMTSPRREIVSEETEEILRRSTMLARDSMDSCRKSKHTRYDDDDVYNGVDIGLDFRPTVLKSYYQDLSEEEVSSSASADIVAEAKYRLKSLEREAQNLESAYMNFHYQMTNVAAVPSTQEFVSSKIQEPSSYRSKSAGSSQHHAPPPEASPIHRPMSSTPYAQKRSSNTNFDDSLHELKGLPSRGSAHKKPPPQFDLSNLSDDDAKDVMERRNSEERIEKPRPITVDDLEARPGSPSIVVVPGEGSSSHTSPTDLVVPSHGRRLVKQKSDLESPLDLPSAALPSQLPPLSLEKSHKASRPVVSMDDAWKGQSNVNTVLPSREREYVERSEGEKLTDIPSIAPPSRLPPLSIDSARKSQQPTVSLDDAWKGPSGSSEQEEERSKGDSEKWEEERQRMQEERKRYELEQWEKEQTELEMLQGKQADDEVEEKRTKSETTDDGIDPLVKEYMNKIQQDKLQKGNAVEDDTDTRRDTMKNKTPSQSEQDISISEVHSLNIASDDDFNWS